MPDPAPPSNGVPDITLIRSGGIAGTTDMVTVTPTGGWVRTGERGTRREVKTGQLGPSDVDRLRALAADPALFAEPGGRRQPCADGYQYTLKVGGKTRTWSACGGGDAPKSAGELVAILAKAVAL